MTTERAAVLTIVKIIVGGALVVGAMVAVAALMS